MSWMRLAACWRYESSLSASTPQRRLGVFSSCSRVKNQREEAPRPDAMTLPPPPAPSPTPSPPGSRTPRQGRATPPHSARRRPRTAPFHPRLRPCACAGAALPARPSLFLSFSCPRSRSHARDHNAPRRLSSGGARRWGSAGKEKVGAMHAGSRTGGAKGWAREERRGWPDVAWRGKAGGRLRRGAWAWTLKSRQVLGPGVRRPFKKRKALLCRTRTVQPPFSFGFNLRSLVGSLRSCPRRKASAYWRLEEGRTWECRRNSGPRLCWI